MDFFGYLHFLVSEFAKFWYPLRLELRLLVCGLGGGNPGGRSRFDKSFEKKIKYSFYNGYTVNLANKC